MNERGQWTSASNAEADLLCPARHLRQRGQPEETSADSESGTRVHKYLAGEKVELTPSEQDVADMALEIEWKAMHEYFGADSKLDAIHEKRFWDIWTRNGVEYRHSGQIDLLIIHGKKAFISERKSLWGDIEESPKNQQVRDQIALVGVNFDEVEEVMAIVNQPRVKRNPTRTVYTFQDIATSLVLMRQRVEASNDPNAKAVPSEKACKFCRAKRVCPEFLNSSLPQEVMPALAVQALASPTTGEFLADTIAALSGDRLGLGLSMSRLLAEAFEAETRKRLADGQSVDGWHLAPGRVREEITDPTTAFNRALALGVTQADFMRAVSVAKGKLENAIREATGLKGGALKVEMQNLLDGATEEKVSAEILERE